MCTVNLIIKENIFKNALWNLKFKKNDLYIGYNFLKKYRKNQNKIQYNLLLTKLINIQQD